MSVPEELATVRGEIDAIDDQLIELLARRARWALRAGRIKRQGGAPVRDPHREAAILERLKSRAQGKLTGLGVERIFRGIMEFMRQLEEVDAHNPESIRETLVFERLEEQEHELGDAAATAREQPAAARQAGARPGDRVRAKLHGVEHEFVVVSTRGPVAPDFVRVDGRLRRLDSGELAAESLQPVAPGPVIAVGDDVLLALRDGTPRRGKLVSLTPDGAIELAQPAGQVCAFPASDVDPEKVWLAVGGLPLAPGDEFAVVSRSGHRYQGVVRHIDDADLVAQLPYVLHLDRLDLDTLTPLVRLDWSHVSAFPVP